MPTPKPSIELITSARGCSRGWVNWGTLRIPRGTLGKIRGITPRAPSPVISGVKKSLFSVAFNPVKGCMSAMYRGALTSFIPRCPPCRVWRWKILRSIKDPKTCSWFYFDITTKTTSKNQKKKKNQWSRLKGSSKSQQKKKRWGHDK